MRARAIGSAFVVAIGIVPTIAGVVPFAVLMLVIAYVAFQEYSTLTIEAAPLRKTAIPWIAGMLFVALAISAGTDAFAAVPALIVLLGITASLVSTLPRIEYPQALVQWALSSTGMGYIGIPLYAAIVLRSLPGALDGSWLANTVNTTTRSSVGSTRGLAWTLLAILVIWIGDTTAYLIGRLFGKHKLAPRISPGKTVEGALGGLLGSALTAALAFALFGLGSAWIGLLAGVVIGGMGQLGDLCESFIKRQAGQKDSGNVIPGHGGMLDRVDALLFAFPTTLVLALLLAWLGH